MAKKIISARMQQRQDTRAAWEAANPVLLKGEIGFLSDDLTRYKVGDGVTEWNRLPYRGSGSGGEGGNTNIYPIYLEPTEEQKALNAKAYASVIAGEKAAYYVDAGSAGKVFIEQAHNVNDVYIAFLSSGVSVFESGNNSLLQFANISILPDGSVLGTSSFDTRVPSVEQVQQMIQEAEGGGGGGVAELMTEITYDELVSLRDSNSLVKGMKYRITDYETMTSQAETASAGHPFDIVVAALDENTLDEKASAIWSERDTDGYFANSNLAAWDVRYCLDNDTERFFWAVTSGSYLLVDLSALDMGTQVGVKNGTFEYNGVTYVKWECALEGFAIYFLTESENPSMGTEPLIYIVEEQMIIPTKDYGLSVPIIGISSSAKNGKGVIYRLIDENNNDLPYDFKNILFTRKITDNAYDADNGVDTLVYTFTAFDEDGSVSDYSMMGSSCFNNKMGSAEILNDNVFLNKLSNTLEYEYHCSSNIFGQSCTKNTFGDGCYRNKFGDNCEYNIFGETCAENAMGDYCYSNICGSNFQNNTFGNTCYNNSFGDLNYHNRFGNVCYENIFENYCKNNIFGVGCGWNTLGENCEKNEFGNSCSTNTLLLRSSFNTFADDCSINELGRDSVANTFKAKCQQNTFANNAEANTLGYNCSYNTFGAYVKYNTFGNLCQSNTFGGGCEYNTFGDRCERNTFGGNYVSNSLGHYSYSNSFGDGCNYNTFGKAFLHNNLGKGCCSNVFGDKCSSNTIGDNCTHNTFGNGCGGNELGEVGSDFYMEYNTFKDYASRNTIVNSESASVDSVIRKYTISVSYKTIEVVRKRTYETYISTNSSGEVVEWCPADLVNS